MARGIARLSIPTALALVAALATGLCLTTLARGPAPWQPIRFARLPGGYQIRVDYTSQGCFNYEHEGWLYTGSPHPQLAVTPYRRDDSRQNEGERISEVAGRTWVVTLTADEVATLDTALDGYRRAELGGCTTVDHIRLTLLRYGKPIRTESYVDDTCADASRGFPLYQLRQRVQRSATTLHTPAE